MGSNLPMLPAEPPAKPEPFWRRRFVRPFLDLLRQGMTPEKIAFTIAIGIALGVTPVIGSTSILCTAAALLFRLNLPAIQLVNYATYPLQIVLLIPFLRLGAWIFRVPPLQLSIKQIFQTIRVEGVHTIVIFWNATWHALVAWLLMASIAGALLYISLVRVLRLARRRFNSEPH